MANVGVDQSVLGQGISNLPPLYQEEYLKNLLANVYRVEKDAEGNPLLDAYGEPIVSGIAAESPLFGTPILDAEGNQLYEKNPDGTDRLDFRGERIPQVEGGVIRPDVAPFTGNQLEAVRLAEAGVGAYEPYMADADATLSSAARKAGIAQTAFEKGTEALSGTTGEYDPSSFSDYYDPFTQNVIGQTSGDVADASRALGVAAQGGVDAGQYGLGSAVQGQQMLTDTTDRFTGQGLGSFMSQYEDAAVQQALADIARSGQVQQAQLGANAASVGAFGGARQGIQESELARNILEQQGRTAAGMRQAGFENAAQRAQAAFEAEQARSQQAAELTGQLGQAGASSAMAGNQMGMTGAQAQADLSMGLAGLRGSGFGAAQELGQNAFQNQMARGQNAGQIFGTLGQGIGSLGTAEAGVGTRQGALGEAIQGAGQRDVNALFNVGALEQGQMQSEYDVQRAADIEEAYEPSMRMQYMSDIFRGMPASSSTLNISSKPAPSPVSSILGNTIGMQNMAGTGILGNIG
tara:strand:+ start:1018 stop:2580 length:1563 start_codon:yes stop_codon:yes gene_type:complete